MYKFPDSKQRDQLVKVNKALCAAREEIEKIEGDLTALFEDAMYEDDPIMFSGETFDLEMKLSSLSSASGALYSAIENLGAAING